MSINRRKSFWSRALPRAGTLMLVGVLAFGAMIENADARRMGGGRSFGQQSRMVQQRPATPPPSQAAQPMQAQPGRGAAGATAAAPAARSRWLGPIAGLAAGLGIAALLSHFGLGGAFASMFANVIVIALIAFVVIWLIRRFVRPRGAATPGYAAAAGSQSSSEPYSQPNRFDVPAGGYPAPQGNVLNSPGTASSTAAPWGVPADFDKDTFLRMAKVHFIRMQEAWDKGDVNDLREFTTPEMFAETRIDLSARGAQANRTDVVQLDAELLGIEEREHDYLASVRFHGLIREEEGAAAEPLDEVWNLSKSRTPGNNEGWLLAGIQQTN